MWLQITSVIQIEVGNNGPPYTCDRASFLVKLQNLFLEILQNSQDNTCARVSFLIKLQATFFTEHL